MKQGKVNLFTCSFNLLVMLVWYLGICWLLQTFEDSKDCFVFFLTLNWFYLTQNLYFHFLLYLLLLAWILLGFEKHKRGISFIYSSSSRMLFAKVNFKWILIKSFSQHIWNFIHNQELYVCSMPVCTLIFMAFTDL